MSVACLRVGLTLLTVIYICISVTLCSKVEWKKTGDSITIQCRSKENATTSFNLKKGLKKDQDIFYTSKTKLKKNLADPSRSDAYLGRFPSVDVVLNNLTRNDTGVYWCGYKTINIITGVTKDEDGEGSVLLIVTDRTNEVAEVDKSTAADQTCNQPKQTLVMTSVIISAAVLSIIFIVLILLVIRKVKCLRDENKPRPVPFNDVYEDMRGTIRR